ncbi:MAG TPA: DUF4038 domain-containing protein [Chitinophagaceae bacterium]|nr:DUF4038 domain-containing protein [Chitinophagaceae bacterium]
MVNIQKIAWLLVELFAFVAAAKCEDVAIWMRFEQQFKSAKEYNNPLYEARLKLQFTSPTGRVKNVYGFWDGELNWKARFMPDEKGLWKWKSSCSDTANKGLDGLSGSFTCTANRSTLQLYQKGAIKRTPGKYHLQYSDGSPFFWTGCTAWNGTLKSTDEEWDYYLENRRANSYNVIQFVTTQWRGGDKNSMGQVAFEGSGIIRINTGFFQHLDKKINEVNAHGLVAAPVLLWALPTLQGRDLSPGYYLPEEECILLARYMVARYGSHHVAWILGGDGRYTGENEQRWKNIGRGVFGDEHPGVVALHPGGGAWIGEAYAKENWLDIIGYQSGHNRAPKTVSWINRGPVASAWSSLPPKPMINMEPVYEEINPDITAADVRNASYWSILSTPTAGITYGANGLWPWLREGEFILNHAGKGERASRWRESLKLPGSLQVGYLSAFMQNLDWSNLKPDSALLVDQPGQNDIRRFVSISRTDDHKTMVAYVPSPAAIKIYNPGESVYDAVWFDPAINKTAKATTSTLNGVLNVSPPPGLADHVLVLKRIK